MRIDILTIFPKMFEGVLNESLLKKAQEKGLIGIKIHNIRDFTKDKHRMVDDAPFGGEGGMVMMVEPLDNALQSLSNQKDKEPNQESIILTSADGKRFDQDQAKNWAGKKHLIIICGHYTGVDERIKLLYPVEEISVGDYVLTGGELPAMIITDAVVRLFPGVLGNFECVEKDSYYQGILGYPQYTRPAEFKGLRVPEILISGDHKKVRLWRKEQALKKTLNQRPELLDKAVLSSEDEKILAKLEKELKQTDENFDK